MGDYLTVADVCIRTGYRRQTIYDLMVKGKLRQGVHYFKPGGNGRPLFKWSALQAWIEGREVSA